MWQEQGTGLNDKKLAPKGTGSGLRGPFKTAAIEAALDRATIRLGMYTLLANI